MSDQPFATHADIAARGLALTSDQEALADQLCEDASDIIRSRWDDVDERVASGELRATSLVRVVASMVKRAMERSVPEGVQSASEATGPFSRSSTFLEGASERLYLTAEDKRLLAGKAADRRAFAVDMAPNASAGYIPDFW